MVAFAPAWRQRHCRRQHPRVHASALAAPDDETVSVEPPAPVVPAAPTLFGLPLKYMTLLLLIFQNSVVSVATSATRTVRVGGGPLYLGSVAVLLSELVKLPVCVALIARDKGGMWGMVEELRANVVVEWADTLRMGVPALCYCLQNLLFFVALSSLSATS